MPSNQHHRTKPAPLDADLLPGQRIRHSSIPLTAFHPATKGIVELVHRSLKAAKFCRTQKRWTETLIFVLHMRTAFKEDLQAPVTEHVYGELPTPGEFMAASSTAGDPTEIKTMLRRHFEQLRPVPAERITLPAVFVYKNLGDFTHYILWQVAVRRPLDAHYSGPYKFLACR